MARKQSEALDSCYPNMAAEILFFFNWQNIHASAKSVATFWRWWLCEKKWWCFLQRASRRATATEDLHLRTYTLRCILRSVPGTLQVHFRNASGIRFRTASGTLWENDPETVSRTTRGKRMSDTRACRTPWQSAHSRCSHLGLWQEGTVSF